MLICHLSLIVWGESHLEVFFRGSLPSQLAEGNLPALHKKALLKYHFYTTETGKESIKNNPLFACLKQYVEVIFHPIFLKSGCSPIQLMAECHNLALKEKGLLFFLTPDVIYSSHTFAAVWRRFEEGKKLFLVGSPRLLREEYLMKLEQITAEKRFDSRRMVQEALHVLHPVTQSLFWDRGAINLWPAHLYWTVPNSAGIVARCFHLHPLAFWSNTKTITATTIDDGSLIKKYLKPAEWHIMQDSDESVIFELSPASHMTPVLTAAVEIKHVSVWLQRVTDPFERKMAKVPIFFRAKDGLFEEISQVSEKIIERILHRASYPPITEWMHAVYRMCKKKKKKYSKRFL